MYTYCTHIHIHYTYTHVPTAKVFLSLVLNKQIWAKIISSGVNWIVGISFPEWVVRAAVRLCPSSVHTSAEYSSQLWSRCSKVSV